MMPSFSKSSVFKLFSIDTKTQSERFQISSVEERFRKVPFSLRIRVDLSNRRNKAAVLNFCGVVWTQPTEKSR